MFWMSLGSTALAQPEQWSAGPGEMAKPNPAALIEKHASDLGISEETLSQIGVLVDEGRPEGRKLRRELRKQKKSMRQLMAGESPSEQEVMALVEKIGELETLVRKHEVSLLLKIQKLLTPAQRASIRSLMEQHRASRKRSRRMRP